MRDRGDRIEGPRAGAESRGAKRRFTGETSVDLPPHRPAQRPVVVAGELHEEVVRVLPIVDRVTLAHLSGRQLIQRAAPGIVHGSALSMARSPTRPAPARRLAISIPQLTLPP